MRKYKENPDFQYINAVQLITYMHLQYDPCLTDDQKWEIEHYKTETNGFLLKIIKNSLISNLFLDGIEAGFNKLYLAGSITLCSAIEASLRFRLLSTERYKDGVQNNIERLARFPNSFTKIIKIAKECGIPIDTLAFPGEDFSKSISPQSEIEMIRNAICHGNFSRFSVKINETDDEPSLFTKDCVFETYQDLLHISFAWLEKLHLEREKSI
jgi:hypothetical protein